jgi:hypothetical protein
MPPSLTVVPVATPEDDTTSCPPLLTMVSIAFP